MESPPIVIHQCKREGVPFVRFVRYLIEERRSAAAQRGNEALKLLISLKSFRTLDLIGKSADLVSRDYRIGSRKNVSRLILIAP